MRFEGLHYFKTPSNLVGLIYIIKCFERSGSLSWFFNSGHKILDETSVVGFIKIEVGSVSNNSSRYAKPLVSVLCFSP